MYLTPHELDRLTVQRARQTPLDEMWSCVPALDIAHMNHKHLPQRLFSN
ncbi:MAG: hypothetical protein SFW36_04440 [Leptolyngbyaceae cyanobacterium bins.59]|nr:hypothetical protein [Leptolyngbyaceae cyanobacterium bins.59]